MAAMIRLKNVICNKKFRLKNGRKRRKKLPILPYVRSRIVKDTIEVVDKYGDELRVV